MMRKAKKIFFALTFFERKIFLGASTLFFISSLALFGIVLGKVTKSVAAEGGTYREGLSGQPSYINPVLATAEDDKGLVRLIFSNIMSLSQKIESGKDGRIWKVRLKDDIRWHDGEPLTADDVIFTIGKIQNPDSRSPLFSSWQGVFVERLSEREVEFNLGVPYAFFDTNLRNLYILPLHLFKDIPVSNWRISERNLKPIGSGPYRFHSYEVRPDGFITTYRLTRNNEYFDMLPFISELEFRYFSSKSELIDAFNAGRIDGIAGFEIDDLKILKRPYAVIYFNLPNYYAVFFNQNQNIALKDESVRRALALAVDKKALVAEIFNDHAKIVNGPIPPMVSYFDPTLARVSSSPERASGILEEAGWKLNPQGLREKAVRNSSVPLEINLTVPHIPFLMRTATFLERAWEKIGVKITLVERDLDDILNSVIKNRDYQMVLFGNTLNAGSDLFSFWHSSERFYPGLNLSLYNNKEVDGLIEAIRQNFDAEILKEQFRTVQQRILGDQPAIFLYSPDYLSITGKNLRGVDAGLLAEPSERFTQTPQWHLKTKRVFKRAE